MSKSSFNRLQRKSAEVADENLLVEFACGAPGGMNCRQKLFVAFGVCRSRLMLKAAAQSKDWRLIAGKIQGRKTVSTLCPKCWVELVKTTCIAAENTDRITEIVEAIDPDRKYITDEIFDEILNLWDAKNPKEVENV